jgi:hypothetical protein
MLTIDEARAYYPTDDPAHDFDHVLRVLAMAQRLAAAEGADEESTHAAAEAGPGMQMPSEWAGRLPPARRGGLEEQPPWRLYLPLFVRQ